MLPTQENASRFSSADSGLLTIALLLVKCELTNSFAISPSIRVNRRAIPWLVGIGIAIVAILLRVYAIDRLPPGLFGDEAVEGLDALDVLAGKFAIWFPAHYGREPIYVYLTAISYVLFGVSALSTRLPAIIAGLLTVPATFLLVFEWARQIFARARALHIAILATTLLSISFWHIQMTRDAHRDTLLPLVESLGLFFLWRARRTGDKVAYGLSGLVLGLAIYTYSPGRFVGIFVALAVAIDLVVNYLASTGRSARSAQKPSQPKYRWSVSGVFLAGTIAFLLMLPLFVYFVQNPAELTRRFDSVSVFDTESPGATLIASVSGNLAQFVIPGAGYQSKHYNLPGKPVFDLVLVPWFLVGLGLALWRIKLSQYRFLVIWFVIMLVPAFLTADMIPKGVRALGVVPGVFIFPALAMDALWSHVGSRASLSYALVILSIVGSALWTTYDYFTSWANLPELPLAFDSDLAEVSAYIRHQASDRPVYISTEVYRPPTEMLLGQLVPTSRYVDPATNIREFDARASLPLSTRPEATYVFVREQKPDTVWLSRIAMEANAIDEGKYFAAYQLTRFSLPQHSLDLPVGSYLRLVGYSTYQDEPSGIALYWRVDQVAQGREDFQEVLLLQDGAGNRITQDARSFPVTPLEWSRGDEFVEWRTLDIDSMRQITVELTRSKEHWQKTWAVK